MRQFLILVILAWIAYLVSAGPCACTYCHDIGLPQGQFTAPGKRRPAFKSSKSTLFSMPELHRVPR